MAVHPLRNTALIVSALVGLTFFAVTLMHMKGLFNPLDWFQRMSTSGRMIVLDSWDLELLSCPGETAVENECQSVSGPYTFEHTPLPLPQKLQNRMRELSEKSTHLRLQITLSEQNLKWIQDRDSEEFLRSQLVLFQNQRCFDAAGRAFCGERTEAFEARGILRQNQLVLTFPLRNGSPFGPSILPPVLVEGNALSNVLALGDKAQAAFSIEGTLLVTLTAFFGILAALFPLSSPIVIMFFLCGFRTLLTTLSYLYESQVWDPLYRLLGSTGYLGASVFLNGCVLALQLALIVAVLRGRFVISKLEGACGCALLGLFLGIALIYGNLGDLATASLFARDAIATLFGSIWIIYFLITEWQEATLTTHDPARRPLIVLQRFVFLFFLVAYGAASAQTVLGPSRIPDILPWQSLFFLPGIGIAVLLGLRRVSQETPEILRSVEIESKS